MRRLPPLEFRRLLRKWLAKRGVRVLRFSTQFAARLVAAAYNLLRISRLVPV